MKTCHNLHQEAIAYLQQSDPILGQLIVQLGDCQLAAVSPSTNLLSALAWAIIAQQISTQVANKIYQKFLAHYANHDALDAMILSQTPDEQLRALGISRYKIRYLKNLAQHIQSDLLTLAQLESLEDEVIIERLTRVKGIGRWTAQMLLIFRLHRPDILPVEDLGIRQAIQKLYQLAQPPDKRQIAMMGEKWKPYRSIASWYLWRSLSDSILTIKL